MRITDISFQFVINVLLLLLLRLPEWLQNWIWKCPCVITINSIRDPPSVLLFPMKHFVSHNLTVRSLSQSNQKTQHKHMTQHSCTPVCVCVLCVIYLHDYCWSWNTVYEPGWDITSCIICDSNTETCIYLSSGFNVKILRGQSTLKLNTK